MSASATTLVILACLAVLLPGLGSFACGGAFHARNSNRIMQARVAAQVVAVMVIVLLALASGGGA